MIPQVLLKQYNVLLLDRTVGKTKAYVATETEPQPKEVNLHEYLDIGEGWCSHFVPFPSHYLHV